MLNVNLIGNSMQMAVLTLEPGQVFYCEAGKFLFSSGDVEMETKLTAPSTGAAGRGGLLRGALDVGRRMITGESFAYQHLSTRGGDGLVAVAGVLPGELRVIELDGATTWLAEKDAFIGAEAGVHMDIAFSGLRAGLSGGEGFLLQKFSGRGSLLIGGAGNFVEINPAEYGGKLKVDTGCIVAFESSVRYGVERVGRLTSVGGIMSGVFGGEGFSLATLEGNGKVILQSMTLEALAGALAKANRRGSSAGGNGQGGLGGLTEGLGDIFG